MIKKLRLCILSVIFLSFFGFFAVLSVSGQQYHSFAWEKERILGQTKWRVGPFRIYPRIQFRNIGYDDNIYRQREDGNIISDYTATFSPEIKVDVLFNNWIILSFYENPEYVYFLEEERERAFNNSYLAGVKVKLFHRFILSGNYEFEKARRRPTSEFDVRADQESKGFVGQIFYETGMETSIGITGAIREFNFEDITSPGEEIYLSQQLNRVEKSGHFQFYYKLHSETFFFLTGGYTDYKFEYEESRWRDSYSYQAMAGIQFPILGNIRGTVYLGYKKLFPRVGYKKRFEGYIGKTNLEYRTRFFNLRLRYSKDVQVSYWTNNVFYLEYIYGGGLSFYLTRFVRLDYDYTNGRNQYPELTLVRLPDESYVEFQRKDEYISHRVGVVFRIFKNTGLGLMLNFWERDSNDFRWGNRHSLFLGGYITYEF